MENKEEIVVVPQGEVKLSKIQKYNLDEVAWKLFWVHSKDAGDIATVLNMVLDKRKDALEETGRLPEEWRYAKISTRDVGDFLRNMHIRIEQEEGRRLTRIRKRTLDSVRQVEEVMGELCTYMETWGDKVQNLMAEDDYDRAAKFYRLIQKDRQQQLDTVKLLTDIRAKFKTYMSFEVLMRNVRQMIHIIEDVEDLPYETKEKLLSGLADIMRQAKEDHEED